METSEEEKRNLAKVSMAWNLKHPTFRKMFPGAEDYARRRALGLPVETKSITLLSEKDEEEGAGGVTSKEREEGDGGVTSKEEEDKDGPHSGGCKGKGKGGHVEDSRKQTLTGPLLAGDTPSAAVVPHGGDFAVGKRVIMSGLSAKNAHYNGVE